MSQSDQSNTLLGSTLGFRNKTEKWRNKKKRGEETVKMNVRYDKQILQKLRENMIISKGIWQFFFEAAV